MAKPAPNITMAGLDPATQPRAAASELNQMFHAETRSPRSSSSPPRFCVSLFALANASALGGRVKPGRGDWRMVWN
jgi:hypothetical protein